RRVVPPPFHARPRMTYRELGIKGAFVITLDTIVDSRGFFARAWDAHELAEHGLESRFVQSNVTFNTRRGTVRGMHFQRAPHEEVKLVRCTRGSVLDVIVDIRDGSPTRLKWESVELSADNRLMVYVPRGLAHGYQT